MFEISQSLTKKRMIKGLLVTAIVLNAVLFSLFFPPALPIVLAVSGVLSSTASIIALSSVLSFVLGFLLTWATKKLTNYLSPDKTLLFGTTIAEKFKKHAIEILVGIIFATTTALSFIFIPSILPFLAAVGVMGALSSFAAGIVCIGLLSFLAGLILVNLPDFSMTFFNFAKTKVTQLQDARRVNQIPHNPTVQKIIHQPVLSVKHPVKDVKAVPLAQQLFKADQVNTEQMKKIGQGGFGKVFVGEVEVYGEKKMVAIKVMLESTLESPDVHPFLAEIATMQNAVHPNIVTLFGCCIRPVSLVMEYMPMGSLYYYFKTQKDHIPWETRLMILKDIVAGLNYLHEKKIVHRDLKGLNVLLFEQDRMLRAKISDFGLSKTGQQLLQTRNHAVGTRAYMAPELFQNKPYTLASDIYSLGRLILEIILRRIPGSDDAIPPDCPEMFKTLAVVCTAIKADKRPTIGKVQEFLHSNNHSPTFFRLPREKNNQKNPGPYQLAM